MPEWVYPDCEMAQVEYALVNLRYHHSFTLLQDGRYTFQYTHVYKITRIQILNVRADEIQDTLDSKGYWEGKPAVSPMFPDTNIGLFTISGTYIEQVTDE